MTLHSTIESKLKDALAPSYLEVINESYKHSVPPGSESHFKVTIVSEDFAGKRLVMRHQVVNALLKEELENGVHALSMETFTDGEWQARGCSSMATPDCLGGSKADR